MSDALYSGELGNIIIKYNDNWRGNYYLKEDLTFTTDRSKSARFYLLKSGDTSILNGDRISLHVGSKTLVINTNGIPSLLDRNQISQEITTFIITNNVDGIESISYESNISLASDIANNKYLKFDWVRKLNGDNYREDFESYPTSLIPQLTINQLSADEKNLERYIFLLERADNPISHSELSRPSITLPTPAPSKTDVYKGFMMITLLVVILILLVIINRG